MKIFQLCPSSAVLKIVFACSTLPKIMLAHSAKAYQDDAIIEWVAELGASSKFQHNQPYISLITVCLTADEYASVKPFLPESTVQPYHTAVSRSFKFHKLSRWDEDEPDLIQDLFPQLLKNQNTHKLYWLSSPVVLCASFHIIYMQLLILFIPCSELKEDN